MVHAPARELLGRHVRRRTHHDALLRVAIRGPRRVGWAAGSQLLGQTEVEHLHPAVGGHHDVGRLQVAVDDALVVGGRQGVGHGRGNLQDALERQPARGNRLAPATAPPPAASSGNESFARSR